MNQKRRWKIERYFKNPHCVRCGILMTLDIPERHQTFPDNYATMFHLKSKYDPTRQLPQRERRRLLICFSCSQNLSDEETLNIPIEERNRRSGRYPTNF